MKKINLLQSLTAILFVALVLFPFSGCTANDNYSYESYANEPNGFNDTNGEPENIEVDEMGGFFVIERCHDGCPKRPMILDCPEGSFSQRRQTFYRIDGHIINLVPIEEWMMFRDTVFCARPGTEVKPLLQFIQYFNITREQMELTIGEMRQARTSFVDYMIRTFGVRRAEFIAFTIMEELEIPNLDVVFTLNNEIIDLYYRAFCFFFIECCQAGCPERNMLSQRRQSFYRIDGPIIELVQNEEWILFRDTVLCPEPGTEVKPLLQFIQHFNIPREKLELTIGVMRQEQTTVVDYMMNYGAYTADSIVAFILNSEFPNLDAIFTFSNEIIDLYYRAFCFHDTSISTPPPTTPLPVNIHPIDFPEITISDEVIALFSESIFTGGGEPYFTGGSEMLWFRDAFSERLHSIPTYIINLVGCDDVFMEWAMHFRDLRNRNEGMRQANIRTLVEDFNITMRDFVRAKESSAYGMPIHEADAIIHWARYGEHTTRQEMDDAQLWSWQFSISDIEAIFSDDINALWAAFPGYGILHNNRVYTPEWIVNNMAAAIHEEQIPLHELERVLNFIARPPAVVSDVWLNANALLQEELAAR